MPHIHEHKHTHLYDPKRLTAWWPAGVPLDTIIPVFRYGGESLVPRHGVRPGIYLYPNKYRDTGTSPESARRRPIISVGQLGKRRYTMHVPVYCSESRLESFVNREPDALIKHVRLSTVSSERVWFSDVPDAPALTSPKLALLVVAPSLWPGHCQMEIAWSEYVLELARGQVANSKSLTSPLEIDPEFDQQLYPDAIGYGHHHVFLARLESETLPSPGHHRLLLVRRSLKKHKSALEILSDLSVRSCIDPA